MGTFEKLIILLPVFLLLIPFVNAQYTCSDTDGGKVYTVKGTVSEHNTYTFNYTDYCVGDANVTLVEYYCSVGNTSSNESVSCLELSYTNCTDGACSTPAILEYDGVPRNVIVTDRIYYLYANTDWYFHLNRTPTKITWDMRDVSCLGNVYVKVDGTYVFRREVPDLTPCDIWNVHNVTEYYDGGTLDIRSSGTVRSQSFYWYVEGAEITGVDTPNSGYVGDPGGHQYDKGVLLITGIPASIEVIPGSTFQFDLTIHNPMGDYVPPLSPVDINNGLYFLTVDSDPYSGDDRGDNSWCNNEDFQLLTVDFGQTITRTVSCAVPVGQAIGTYYLRIGSAPVEMRVVSTIEQGATGQAAQSSQPLQPSTADKKPKKEKEKKLTLIEIALVPIVIAIVSVLVIFGLLKFFAKKH